MRAVGHHPSSEASMRLRTTLVATVILSSATLWAADYLTHGVDPGRTGWMKDEKVFNTTNVRDMKLLWKVKLDTKTRAMHNLFNPLIVEKVTTPQGTREMALVAGVNDDLFGIDVANGQQLWHRQFDNVLPEALLAPVDNVLCPGGLTDVPVIAPGPTPGNYTLYVISWDGRLRQVDVATGQDTAPPEKFLPGNGKPYALNLVNGVIYTASAQGCGGQPNAFYSFDLATRKASIFQPAGGGLWGRRGDAIDPEGRVYIGTGDARFDPGTKSLGNGIVAVKIDANKQLQLADYFAPKNANWLQRRDLDVNVTPMVFDYQGKKFLVGTSKECRLWLLDRDNLGGEDHRTPLDTSPLICNDIQAFDAKGIWGSLSTWQDASGTQWVLAPFWGPVSREFTPPIQYGRPKMGGVAALKLQQVAGNWKLTPAWLSRDIDMAEETIIANGVVFAYGAGEDSTQTVQDSAWDEPTPGTMGGGLSSGAKRRIPGSRRAELVALDGQTGKELWSSGTQIASWNHFSGLTVANGRAYLGTFDGYMYCFGVK
jgi:outer membrane protein assembly factor BamB